MFTDLKIAQLASAMARHAEARHAVIAKNIANANTPGYQAKDIAPFESVAKRFNDKGRPGDTADLYREQPIQTSTSRSPNGNTVSLEDQTFRAAESVRSHETAMMIYTKTIELLRSTLGRSR